ncbi:MAG: polymer-forming cytoskeletal protein [Patescibacteria group bacterium]
MIFEKEIINKTRISSTSKVKGDISCQEDVVIEGEVSGKVSTSGKLEIKKSAQVIADLIAKDIIIAGKVEGNIQTQKLEITETGKVFGDIISKIISIAAGAVLIGGCKVKVGEEKKEEIKEVRKEK